MWMFVSKWEIIIHNSQLQLQSVIRIYTIHTVSELQRHQARLAMIRVKAAAPRKAIYNDSEELQQAWEQPKAPSSVRSQFIVDNDQKEKRKSSWRLQRQKHVLKAGRRARYIQ